MYKHSLFILLCLNSNNKVKTQTSNKLQLITKAKKKKEIITALDTKQVSLHYQKMKSLWDDYMLRQIRKVKKFLKIPFEYVNFK